jgi:hypothetical protein
MSVQKIILTFCLICFVSSGLPAQQTVPPPPKPADDGPSLEVTMKFIQEKLNAIGPLRYSVSRRAVDADSDSVFNEADELSDVVADPQRCTISYRLQESAKPISEESSRNFDASHDRGPDSSEAPTKAIAYSQDSAGSYQVQGRSQEGARPRNTTFVVDLKEVKKIEVRSVEQDLNEASGGKTSWTLQPPIFEVVAQTHLAGYRRQLPAKPEPPPAEPSVNAIIEDIFRATPGKTTEPTQRHQGVMCEPLPRESGVFSVDDEELAKRLARAINHAVELCTPDKKAEPF